jgi:hypothetical protein
MDDTVPTRNSIAGVARKILMIKQTTLFHYSHTPLKKWFMVLYLFFVLWPGCSIMETSLQTDISYYICYRFIRTVMERIASSSKSDNVKLKGVIETDEFYIKADLKGF